MGQPVAEVRSPNPGFTNEVFSAGLLTFAQVQQQLIVQPGVEEPIGVRNTYVLDLIEGGQGYFPRNGTDLAIPFSTVNPGGDRVLITIPDVTVVNGRITSIPDQITVKFPRAAESGVFIGEPIPADNAVIDNLFLPGNEGRIRIAASFFKAGADLDTYRILVNGEDVTPGNGNLVPTAADGSPLDIDIPVLRYPFTTAPPPGDYVVYAEVTDKQGEVGVSEPINFTILPFEPLEIRLSRQGEGSVEQGAEVTYFVDVTQVDLIENVEFFDSSSGESLGEAASIEVEGERRFRFIRTLDRPGPFSLFARATATNGQTAVSSPIEILVNRTNDLEVSLISPENDRDIFRGQSFSFVAEASATPGIESVSWIVNNVEEELDEETPYEFDRTFNVVGDFRVRLTARDNFGNSAASEEEIRISVNESDVTTSITSPLTDQFVVSGETGNIANHHNRPADLSDDDWRMAGHF